MTVRSQWNPRNTDSEQAPNLQLCGLPGAQPGRRPSAGPVILRMVPQSQDILQCPWSSAFLSFVVKPRWGRQVGWLGQIPSLLAVSAGSRKSAVAFSLCLRVSKSGCGFYALPWSRQVLGVYQDAAKLTSNLQTPAHPVSCRGDFVYKPISEC